jgi:hypothetical protein
MGPWGSTHAVTLLQPSSEHSVLGNRSIRNVPYLVRPQTRNQHNPKLSPQTQIRWRDLYTMVSIPPSRAVDGHLLTPLCSCLLPAIQVIPPYNYLPIMQHGRNLSLRDSTIHQYVHHLEKPVITSNKSDMANPFIIPARSEYDTWHSAGADGCVVA